MKKKKILWPALLASVSFVVLLLLWWSRSAPPIKTETEQQEQVEKSSVQMESRTEPASPKKTPPPPIPEIVVQEEDSFEEGEDYQEFIRELEKLEHEHQEMSSECYDNIDGKLRDLNYIDPRSDFYKNLDRVDDLLHKTLVNMSSTGPALEMTWLIEDYIVQHEPPNTEALIERYHGLQEACLIPSGVTFLQTAIEACRSDCPPRLKNRIGNVIFDGVPLIIGNYLGAERLMLALSLLEKANKYGPYHISTSGEIEDLRYRVQQSYELYREELQQNEGKSARMALAFNRYLQDNRFLKEEILNLIENSSERYYP